MKIPYLLALLCFAPLLPAQEKEKNIDTEINAVTVFSSGAQVSRNADVSLSSGLQSLAFTGLSPYLDEKSIQFNAKGDISVLSVNYAVRYPESSAARKDSVSRMNEQLRELLSRVKFYEDQLAISVNEEQVLLNNTDFDIWEGMTVTQLEQGVNLVRSRLTEIKKRKQEFRQSIDELNEQRQKIILDLQQKRIVDATPFGVVLVKIHSESARKINTQLSYVVADAGWVPYYDLKVKDIASPLQLEYKAKVYQNTGEDWNNIKLELSTANPYEEANLPNLQPWILNYGQHYYPRNPGPGDPRRRGITGTFSGVVIDAKSGESIPYANVVALDQNRNLVQGTASDLDGRFNLVLNSPAVYLEVTFLGYNKHTETLNQQSKFHTIRLSESAEVLSEIVVMYQESAPSKVSMDDVQALNIRGSRATGDLQFVDGVKIAGGGNTISRNPVNLRFSVERPYDIPSNGAEYTVAITQYELTAHYLYKAVPKLNEHAFLTADISGWENLNLMNGNAGVYFEGTYLGETYLNPEEAGDTLRISLGKDENIRVLRREIEQKQGRNFFGNKREEKFHYEIKVRNNKTEALEIEISDQYPISGNEAIEVERMEHSDGKVDYKSGIILWKFKLPPGAEKIINLEYELSWEKNKNLHIR